MIDESEAKTKWCPFARLPVPGVGAVNRAINHIERDPAGGILESSVDISLSTCLGSACMAWRWAGWRDANDNFRDVVTSYPPSVEAAAQWIRIGYCGLTR